MKIAIAGTPAFFATLLIVASMGAGPTTEPISQAEEERRAKAAITFRGWCKGLMAEQYRPPPDTQVEYIVPDGKDFPVDLVRATYKVAGRTITVTQTKCLFCVKVEEIPDGANELNAVSLLVRAVLQGAENLQLEWTNAETAPGAGRAIPKQDNYTQFLQNIRFLAGKNSLRIYGYKLRDGPSPAAVGPGISMNSAWFTKASGKDAYHGEDDGAAAVEASLLR